MSNQKQSITQINDKLLTAVELEICQKIAALDTELAGQRAAILVAINEGSTHTQASEQTDLTVGQIRYLLTTFRRKRLAIFPDDVLSQAQLPAEPKEEAQTELQSAPAVDEGEIAKKSEKAWKDEASLAEVVKVEKKLKREKAKAKKKDKEDKATKAGKKTKKADSKAKAKKKDKKSKKGKAKKADKKKSKK